MILLRKPEWEFANQKAPRRLGGCDLIVDLASAQPSVVCMMIDKNRLQLEKRLQIFAALRAALSSIFTFIFFAELETVQSLQHFRHNVGRCSRLHYP